MPADPLPEQIEFRERWLSYWPIALTMAAVATSAILRVPSDMTVPLNGQTLRWVIGIGFPLLLLIGFVSRARAIRLDLEGFNDTKGRRVRWRECSEFVVNKNRVGRIELSDIRTTSSELGSVWIWGNYGIANAELAAVMNSFRARAWGINA